MPSLFLLIAISLAMASQRAANQLRLAPVANGATAVIKDDIKEKVALSDAATAPPAIALIEADAAGLMMPSETDAPFVVKYWASQQTELLPGDVAALVEQKADAPLETQTVAEFFKNAATVEDWMDDDEKATAQQFQKLIVTLQTQLENPRVYLFGERERTIVIIGKVKGGFGGVVTLVVET